MGHLDEWVSICLSIDWNIRSYLPPQGESPPTSKSMIACECGVER